MPTVLPGTLTLRARDGAALEIPAGTPLPAERTLKHVTAFDAKDEWALELVYKTAQAVGVNPAGPHERKFPLIPWDGTSPAGREIMISLWVSPHRAAFVEIGLEGKEVYRFDPVALRDGSGNVAIAPTPPGATVVERGFASASQPPPTNLRVVASCEKCSRFFAMRVYHAGRAGLDFFYCEKCPSVTAVPLSDPRSAGFWKGIETRRLDVVDDPHVTPEQAVKDNRTVYAAFEAALAPCKCGGAHRFLSSLRCPHCAAPWTDFKDNLWRRLEEVYVCHVSGFEYVAADNAWRR